MGFTIVARNYTHVWQNSGNMQSRTLRLGSLEPHQGWLFGDPYLSCYVVENINCKRFPKAQFNVNM